MNNGARTPLYTLEDLVPAGGVLTDYYVREPMLPSIKSGWFDPGRGTIFEVIGRPRTFAAWSTLARFLTATLLESSHFYALALESISSSMEQNCTRWMGHILQADAGRPRQVSFKSWLWPYPRSDMRFHLSYNINHSVGFFALARADQGEWLNSLWEDTGRDETSYEHDPDVLLIGLNGQEDSYAGFQEHLGVADVAPLMGEASSWLLPLDGYVGFVVGVRPEDPMYRVLRSSAS
jgi:hypothetical protein